MVWRIGHQAGVCGSSGATKCSLHSPDGALGQLYVIAHLSPAEENPWSRERRQRYALVLAQPSHIQGKGVICSALGLAEDEAPQCAGSVLPVTIVVRPLVWCLLPCLQLPVCRLLGSPTVAAPSHC